MNFMAAQVDMLSETIAVVVEAAVRRAISANPGTTGQRLLTIDEAATYLKRSPREMNRMVAAGHVPAVGKGRAKRVDIVDLDKWIAENKH